MHGRLVRTLNAIVQRAPLYLNTGEQLEDKVDHTTR